MHELDFLAALKGIKHELKRIADALEQFEAAPEEPKAQGCQHEHRKDLSTMGQAPGSYCVCLDCGTELYSV